jgi:peptidyl-prolyl cis-trans isomerase SurA
MAAAQQGTIGVTQWILFLACLATLTGGMSATCAAQPRSQQATARPATPAARPEVTQSAISVVNDQIISQYDLDQRIKLFIVTSGARVTDQDMPFIREQVLRSLQDEVLQVKEAIDHGISVTKDEVDQSLAAIARDNNTTVAGVEQMLAKGGVTIGTFRAQITAQIAWNKTVQGRYGSRLEIREEDVTAAIERVKQGSDKPQFHIYEIYLAVDNPSEEAKVRTTAEQILAQIRGGAPFMSVARQFSQAPSAAQGGEVGWVVEGQLSDELNAALKNLRRGETSQPIRSAGGFYIVHLRARRAPAGTPAPVITKGLPAGSVALARFMVPVPQGANAEYRQRALAFATNVAQGARSCADLQRVAAQVRAFYMSLGTVNPRGLSAQVQTALAQTEPGGITAPFFSSDGIELIARCEPRIDPVETIQIPTPEQMRAQLFQQKVGMLARSYLRDLRRDAVIETR